MNNPMLPINPKLLVKEERIIWAAIRVFSHYPFSVATVRMIANEAELPVSAVMYHFKTKENLYEAVFDRVAPYRGEELDRYRQFLDTSRTISREEAKTEFQKLLGEMVDGFYEADEKSWYMRVVFFEWLYPSPLFESLYEKHFKRNMELFVRMIQAVKGNDDSHHAVMQAVGIMGNIMSYRMLRGFTGKKTETVDFNKEEREEIKAWVIRNALSILQEKMR